MHENYSIASTTTTKVAVFSKDKQLFRTPSTFPQDLTRLLSRELPRHLVPRSIRSLLEESVPPVPNSLDEHFRYVELALPRTRHVQRLQIERHPTEVHIARVGVGVPPSSE